MTPSPDPLQSFRLDGEVAIVTGGGNGIGRAVALAYARAGAAAVAVVDRDAAAAERVAAEIAEEGGTAAASFPFDVADEAAVERGFAAIAERFGGRLDVLFNNAGTAIRRPTLELPLADWQKVVDVNLTGVFLCARAAARAMLKAGGAKEPGGRIVNTASIMGFSGGGLYPNISYAATKGGVVNLTRALAVEWARQGIRVNAVAPTWVRTEFIRGLTDRPELLREIERVTPMGRLAEPDEIVGAVLFLSTRASSMVTGHVLAVDGGFLAQ
jgi:NAD(P)-dependent dehydrogenase (short-subunit alcohol dehydrogenase family)